MRKPLGAIIQSDMTYKFLIILSFAFPTISLGQNLSDSLFATFYNKTLTYYYSDTTTYEDQIKFGCILYQTDFDTTKLLRTVGRNTFKFFTSKTNKHSLLNKPLKNNIDRRIYWIKHQTFGQDTVDITIGAWTITHVDKKHLSINVWCGGTMGYLPNARFIFNKLTNAWLFSAPRQQAIKQEQTKIRGK